MQLTRQLRISSLIRLGAATAWMALIFYLSAQPSLPRLYDRFESMQSILGHFVEYAILALLLRWAVRGNFPAGNGSGARHLACWAFLIAVAYGISDEFHQHFVPGRHMDPLDLLTDAIGVAVALWVAGRVEGRRAAAHLADERRSTELP